MFVSLCRNKVWNHCAHKLTGDGGSTEVRHNGRASMETRKGQGWAKGYSLDQGYIVGQGYRLRRVIGQGYRRWQRGKDGYGYGRRVWGWVGTVGHSR